MLVTLAPSVLGLGIAILLAGSLLLVIEDVPERKTIVRNIRLLLRRPVERDGG
jgi:F0F1-type ATP synthase alpha subunit